MSCPSHGHLFCRECAVSNLLAQNKELKRLKKDAERRRLEDAQDDAEVDEEARVRAVEEFERVQMGLAARPGGSNGQKIVGRSNGKVILEEEDKDAPQKGTKRIFELDEDELLRIARDERTATKKRMFDEKNAKSSLPSFWVPGLTPSDKSRSNGEKAERLKSVCPASAANKPHDFNLKTLITANFTESKPAKGEDSRRTCPSCQKALSNGTKAVLAKPCGHVLCKPCSDKFQKAPEKNAHEPNLDDSERCYVCQEDVTTGKKARRKKGEDGEKEVRVERGLVELSSEGTGFAGGGGNVVKRDGVAFQC